MSESTLPDTWTLNAGESQRELCKGMLVRMMVPSQQEGGGWRYRMYAVSKVSGGSAILVPTIEGGWSSGGETIHVSVNSEVEYRRDDGPLYNADKYGAGIVSARWRITRVAPPKVGNEPLHPSARTPTPTPAPSAPPADSREDPQTDKASVEAPTREEETVATTTSEPQKKKVSPPPVKVGIKRNKPTTATTAATAAPKAASADEGGETKVATKNQKPQSKKPQPKVMRTGKKSAKPATSATASASAAAGAANDYPYSLAAIAEKAGVPASRVNALRRAGLLPKRGGFKNFGKAVMYSDRALAAVVRLQEKGVKIPGPGTGTGTNSGAGKKGSAARYKAVKGGTKRSAAENQKRSVAALGARVGGAKKGRRDGGGPLAGAIADARAKAQQWSDVAAQLEQLQAAMLEG